MATPLKPASVPLSMIDGSFTEKGESTLLMHCHDRTFANVTVVDENERVLYTAERIAGLMSPSWRRTVKDSIGTHLFDLRHPGTSTLNKWLVETPNGKEICTMKHPGVLVDKVSENPSAFEMTFLNVLDEEAEVKLEIRPNDAAATITSVLANGQIVAVVKKVAVNDVIFLKGRDRSTWEARISGGIDHCIILVIMLCLAERQHVWRS